MTIVSSPPLILARGWNRADPGTSVSKMTTSQHLPSNTSSISPISARVMTPGIFELPEAVIEDMYRPGVMARTEAGHTDVEAR